VAIEKLHITQFLQHSKDAILVDVRSPGEYTHAHIPGALNIPLFSDEERSLVGTAYKQVSRQQAIKLGLDFFGPKMRQIVELVEQMATTKEVSGFRAEAALYTGNPVFIYCWRGGMRSAAVAWLLNLYGFSVTTLAGGYKAYRNHVLKTFEQPFQLNMLGGFTGSGKTELLKQLEKGGAPVIDLETIASHKGSAFGNINMPAQPSQEQFENLLAGALWTKTPGGPEVNELPSEPIWVEDESQRLGHVNIPNAFWNTMRRSPVYFLEVPFEERLKHLTEEYSKCDKERMLHAIDRISKRLGGLDAKLAKEALLQNDFEGCFRVLLQYYDKHYLRGLHNRENLPALLRVIKAQSVSTENTTLLLTKHQTV